LRWEGATLDNAGGAALPSITSRRRMGGWVSGSRPGCGPC
jgi:hypothetical protein